MTGPTTGEPTVTVLIPTYQEAGAIDTCLEAVARQTYGSIVETLVIDGGSDDGTQAMAAAHRGVTVLENPDRIQAAALNIGIAAAAGEVLVRVDGHCVIADDYVERCVAALAESGAAMVGGGMTPVAHGSVQEGIADAMASRFGAGPARFHAGGAAGWVDTVYLGAYRREVVRTAGGYATDVGVNEDSELAHRMSAHGGIWFDPSIRSVYEPRSSLRALARQFYRYGRSRAATAKRHPASVKPRQLAPPALLLALVALPKRRWTLGAYAAGVAAATAIDGGPGPIRKAVFFVALPIMHVCWAVGFLVGLAGLSR
ncbi:glycosyltransferase family 2 protein [Aquihabitans daechungensis]|uniref:glycosyltransferase family 2 protein n=1 Tax=Aquihabitans daechungensis TaxID=1052257 RepID=UPI003B9F7E8F